MSSNGLAVPFWKCHLFWKHHNNCFKAGACSSHWQNKKKALCRLIPSSMRSDGYRYRWRRNSTSQIPFTFWDTVLSDRDSLQVSAHTVSSTLQRSLVLVLHLNFIYQTQDTLLRICCSLSGSASWPAISPPSSSSCRITCQRTSATTSTPPTNCSAPISFCARSAAVFVQPGCGWVPAALQKEYRTEPLRRRFIYHVH